MQTLVESLYPPISEEDLIHISSTTNTPVKTLQKIAAALEKLNADGLKALRMQVELVTENKRYLKNSSTQEKSYKAV